MNLNDRVVVDNIHTGTVRYIGRVGSYRHILLGIELDGPYGDNNGSRAGKVYFRCKSRHGVFKGYNEVKKFSDHEYNRTGLLSYTQTTIPPEVQEILSEDKRVTDLLEENIQLQRELEQLRKENNILSENLAKEKERTLHLEDKLLSHSCNTSFNTSFSNGSSSRSSKDILIDLLKEVETKMEVEKRIFSTAKKTDCS
ncbi:hypothetical protein NEOKW01_1593 [Nematocida sp. AWRm80]|nr:hypothetical protein NEOKW01_1593 [Nematocida sp. AWRm80]